MFLPHTVMICRDKDIFKILLIFFAAPFNILPHGLVDLVVNPLLCAEMDR